jgi:hypothetical protein
VNGDGKGEDKNMSDPWIKVNFSKLPEEINAELRAKGSRLREVLFTKVSALTYLLQGDIINKLSGPVLKRKTGTLASSVAAQTVTDGTAITGKVSITGGARDYALIHVCGRTTPYQILATKANALRFVLNGPGNVSQVCHASPDSEKPFHARHA